MENNKTYYSIEIKNTQQQLVNILNNCKLPFSVQLLIMNNLSNLVADYAEQEYEADTQAQAQELEEIKKKEQEEKEGSSEEQQ